MNGVVLCLRRPIYFSQTEVVSSLPPLFSVFCYIELTSSAFNSFRIHNHLSHYFLCMLFLFSLMFSLYLDFTCLSSLFVFLPLTFQVSKPCRHFFSRTHAPLLPSASSSSLYPTQLRGSYPADIWQLHWCW